MEKYFLKRIVLVKGKVTTAAKGNVENFDVLKEELLLEVKNENDVCMDEIPKDLIINFDQTSINYICTNDIMDNGTGGYKACGNCSIE